MTFQSRAKRTNPHLASTITTVRHTDRESALISAESPPAEVTIGEAEEATIDEVEEATIDEVEAVTTGGVGAVTTGGVESTGEAEAATIDEAVKVHHTITTVRVGPIINRVETSVHRHVTATARAAIVRRIPIMSETTMTGLTIAMIDIWTGPRLHPPCLPDGTKDTATNVTMKTVLPAATTGRESMSVR